MTEYLSELQLSATTLDGPKIAVIAGAGSGKTAVLVERALRLIRAGQHVLVFAFTRSAVDEIRARIGGGSVDLGLLKVTTIHGFCYEILARRHGQRVPQLVTSEELNDLVKKCRTEIGYENNCSLRAITDALANKPDGNGYATLVAREVRNRLRESNRVHFEGLVDAAGEIISTTAPEELPWTHILCDEAQDLHRGLWSVIASLEMRGPRALFLVGDPRQAIFGFTGGDAKAFVAFSEMDPTHTIALEANYRSARHIVDYANGIFTDGMGAEMMAVREDWGSVDEIPEMGERLLEALDRTLAKYGRVAVIARTNAELDDVAALLTTNSRAHFRVPRVGDRRQYIGRFMAWLRCVANPWDEMAARVLFGEIAVAQHVAEGIAPGSKVAGYQFTPECGEEDEELNRFTACVANGWSAQEYLTALTREELTDADFAPGRDATITLATAHGAKGKEWPAALVLLPGFYGRQRELGLDARRCLYVAATRAKDMLVLMGGPQT